MKSHTYEFDFQWLLRHLGPTVLMLALIAGLLHLSKGLLPKPRATWDMDRTIMATKADLSSMDTGADIVLIGDSYCLMNIDALKLSQLTGKKVINLGTVSFLDMDIFSNLLERYLKAQSKTPSRVILMLHPDFLRRSSPSKSHVAWINDYIEARDHPTNGRSWGSVEYLLGVHIIRGRILAWLPRPLSAAFGSYFGFTSNLEEYIWAHNGSAVDPRRLKESDLKGSKEYRISTSNKQNARLFSETIPEGVVLSVVLSPTPESFADAALV